MSYAFIRLTVLSVQGWSSVIPKFSAVDFVSFYVEIPVMLVMYFTWLFIKRPQLSPLDPTTLHEDNPIGPPQRPSIVRRAWTSFPLHDSVNTQTVDLRRDEHHEDAEDAADDERRDAKLKGRWRKLWKVYYAVV